MELREVNIEKVKPNNYNPNSMTPTEYNNLMFGLRKYSQVVPILVRKSDKEDEYIIVDGEHRWKAAKEIGLSEVPVKRYTLTDSERRLLRQELNKIRGTHDYQDDRMELDNLLDAGYDDEITELLEGRDEAEEFDDLLDGTPDFDAIDADEQPALDESEDAEGDNTVRCPDCGNTFTHE